MTDLRSFVSLVSRYLKVIKREASVLNFKGLWSEWSDLCEEITNLKTILANKSLSKIQFYSDHISQSISFNWKRYLNILWWGVSQELDISNKSGSSWAPTVLFPGTQSHNTSGPGHRLIPSRSASSWLWHYIVYSEYSDDIAPQPSFASDLSLTNSEEDLQGKHWHGVF